MKCRFFAATLLAALATTGLTAAAESVEKPARVFSATVRTAAIVESVDRETREIRLIDAQGRRFKIVADDRVRNFDQIEARDRVVTEFYESVAIAVVPGGAEPSSAGIDLIEVAPLGQRPAIGEVRTEFLSGEIVAIKRDDRLVTVRTEDDELHTIRAAPDARLDLVDVGDTLGMSVTTAVAISVEKPPAD